MTKYVTEAATSFHKFYNACRVRGEEEPLMQARLALCSLTGQVIRNVLGILKVSCPERMLASGGALRAGAGAGAGLSPFEEKGPCPPFFGVCGPFSPLVFPQKEKETS